MNVPLNQQLKLKHCLTERFMQKTEKKVTFHVSILNLDAFPYLLSWGQSIAVTFCSRELFIKDTKLEACFESLTFQLTNQLLGD